MREKLEEASKAMAHLLTPVGEEGLGRALMPLMLTTVMPNMDGMSDAMQQSYFAAKVSEYGRLLAHYPADIIRDACDAHVKRSKFFPAIAELCEFAEPALALRHRQAKRLAVLVKNGGKPPVVREEFKPEPEEVRLRANIKRYRDNPNHPIVHTLHRRAIESERRLAVIEGREVEEWAKADAPSSPAAATQPIAGTLPGDGAKWSKVGDAHGVTIKRTPEQAHAIEQTRKAKATMADAGMPWRAGEPLYQQPHEEPPPPDEIPEGDAP